ncbi:MAG TPA: hypothetical protein VMA83_10270 [Solirubrobacteraceae bacterium]|nr:hypothetical protein [Solirubrobacteraceae bacterium]
MADEDDWRACFVVSEAPHVSIMDRLVHHGESPEFDEETAAIGEDIVATHDGARIFLYAASRDPLERARTTVAGRLEAKGIGATSTVSLWDEAADDWRQVDPPLAASETERLEAADRTASERETRTVVASIGELIRPEFEQTMLDAAARLGVECEIVEHRHLMTTQVGFKVSGPRFAVEEFARELHAATRSTVRCEGVLLASPL